MLVKLNKYYIAKHKNFPTMQWETNYYWPGKLLDGHYPDTPLWVKPLYLEQKIFKVVYLSGLYVNLYFPDLSITVIERQDYLSRFYEITPTFYNIIILWEQLNV